jgi:hypothetical protein
MRTRVNPDGTLVIEVDIELDVKVTFVFERKDGPIVFSRALCDYTLPDGRVFPVWYGGIVPDVVLSLATERALDACAEHDAEPVTERKPPRGT